jgi:hypothetical protein
MKKPPSRALLQLERNIKKDLAALGWSDWRWLPGGDFYTDGTRAPNMVEDLARIENDRHTVKIPLGFVINPNKLTDPPRGDVLFVRAWHLRTITRLNNLKPTRGPQ